MSTSFIHASVSVAFYPRLYLPIACAFSILAVAYTLSCPPFPCDQSCPDVGACSYGKVKDQCGCCDVCGLGPGVRCGGHHSILGKCGDGLVCNINWTIPAGLRPAGRCIREVHQLNTTSPNSSSTENATTTTTTASNTTENTATTASAESAATTAPPTSICPPFPCDQSCPDVGACSYGKVKDPCGCCDVCGLGPGVRCGGPYSILGKCGDGLVCNINWMIPAGLRPAGWCIREVHQLNTTSPNSSSTENATTTTTTASNTTENTATTASAESAATTTTPTSKPSTEECRESCSVEFCSDRARICSAKGKEYSRVQARTPCQHTSCRACFLLVRANCTACPEPPNKKCLRRYHECVRDHYHRSAIDDVFLRLEDQRARSAEGQVFCHIPEVGTWSEPNSH